MADVIWLYCFVFISFFLTQLRRDKARFTNIFLFGCTDMI